VLLGKFENMSKSLKIEYVSDVFYF